MQHDGMQDISHEPEHELGCLSPQVILSTVDTSQDENTCTTYVDLLLEMQQYIDTYIAIHQAVIPYRHTFRSYLGRIDISNIVIHRCIGIKMYTYTYN